MLCLPLGGVSLYEVLAAYLALILSRDHVRHDQPLACSSYFQPHRGLAGGVLSADPAAGLVGVCSPGGRSANTVQTAAAAHGHGAAAAARLILLRQLFRDTAARLLHPPDVGSERQGSGRPGGRSAAGRGPGDSERPVSRLAVRSGQAQRLLADGANPVFDKEMRSEMFSQGTLMLRVVIQVSMFLAIPLMAFCLYIWPDWRPGISATWCCSTCWSARCFRPAASPASASAKRSTCC